ncbi:MAG: deoxyribose-phosphate aldolase, partial [Eubacterium sp.]
MLKSKMDDAVEADIRAVVKAVGDIPLKVILEVPLLTEDEIVRGAEIVKNSGASFVKTGTGWAGATTLRHIELIKKTVLDTIPIKVAGGVRDVDTLLKMVDMGVSRFGIGYRSAINIMEDYEKRLIK